MRVWPIASAPNMSARWLMDLSPGTAICPLSGAAGRRAASGLVVEDSMRARLARRIGQCHAGMARDIAV
jgi:hypothetical protein